jgi:hypothetical protein
MKCLNLNFLGCVACFIEFLQDKNTTEHPHKLSSQIVKERSQLLSWEAGIIPTFNLLPTPFAALFLAVTTKNSIYFPRQIYFRFATYIAFPCGSQRPLPPKKCALYAPSWTLQGKLHKIRNNLNNTFTNNHLQLFAD